MRSIEKRVSGRWNAWRDCWILACIQKVREWKGFLEGAGGTICEVGSGWTSSVALPGDCHEGQGETLQIIPKCKVSFSSKIHSEIPLFRHWINPETNATYASGDILKRPVLAKTLERLGSSPDPVKLFYHGEMAKTMAQEFKDGGGLITEKDLADYKVREYANSNSNDHFRGTLTMCGGPPPSSFGVTQLIVSVMSSKLGSLSFYQYRYHLQNSSRKATTMTSTMIRPSFTSTLKP